MKRSPYRLQSMALLALNRLRVRPQRLPLFAPPMLLWTGGRALSHIYKDVFVNHAYASLEPLPPNPRILDAGAHLGLATLFFLDHYPGARVTTVEANPATAALLRKSLRRHRRRVTLIEKALATRSGRASFFVTRVNPVNVNAGLRRRERTDTPVDEIEVELIDVAEVIDGPFDFAKIDIEGAEYDILTSERFTPDVVRSMVVEFHDVDRDRAALDDILALLVDQRGYTLSDHAGRPLDRRHLTLEGDAVLLRLGRPTGRA